MSLSLSLPFLSLPFPSLPLFFPFPHTSSSTPQAQQQQKHTTGTPERSTTQQHQQKHTTGTPAKAHHRHTRKGTTQQHQQKLITGTPAKAHHRHTSKSTLQAQLKKHITGTATPANGNLLGGLFGRLCGGSVEGPWRGRNVATFHKNLRHLKQKITFPSRCNGDGHLAWPFTIPHMSSGETDKTDRPEIKRQCQCRRRRHSPLVRAFSIFIECRRPNVCGSGMSACLHVSECTFARLHVCITARLHVCMSACERCVRSACLHVCV